MKFYNKDNDGNNLAPIIWNPDTNSALAEFVGGEYVTESEHVISKLKGMGYHCESDGPTQKVSEVELDIRENPELQEKPFDLAEDYLPPTEGMPIFIDHDEAQEKIAPRKKPGRPLKNRPES